MICSRLTVLCRLLNVQRKRGVSNIKEYDVTVEKGLINSKPVIITRTVTANNPQAAKFRAIADVLDSTSCGGQAKLL